MKRMDWHWPFLPLKIFGLRSVVAEEVHLVLSKLNDRPGDRPAVTWSIDLTLITKCYCRISPNRCTTRCIYSSAKTSMDGIPSCFYLQSSSNQFNVTAPRIAIRADPALLTIFFMRQWRHYSSVTMMPAIQLSRPGWTIN